jgi:hypothetical protein
MSEWQPIESAPKGTRVLAYPHVNGHVVAAFLSEHGEWLTIPGRYAFRPTHWLPLPDPPGRSGAAGLSLDRLKELIGRANAALASVNASHVLALNAEVIVAIEPPFPLRALGSRDPRPAREGVR